MNINDRNQKTDRAFLFGRQHKKQNNLVLDRRIVSQKINEQVVAYLNSGGQIQKCTPFAYSNEERETLGVTHRKTINKMSEKFYK